MIRHKSLPSGSKPLFTLCLRLSIADTQAGVDGGLEWYLRQSRKLGLLPTTPSFNPAGRSGELGVVVHSPGANAGNTRVPWPARMQPHITIGMIAEGKVTLPKDPYPALWVEAFGYAVRGPARSVVLHR